MAEVATPTEAFEIARPPESDEPAPSLAEANLRLEQGRLGEAEAEFRRVLLETPTSAGAHNGLGLVARARGAREEALDRFRQASESDPNNPWFRCSIGSELIALGRLDEAQRAFEQALAKAPGLGAAHSGLGQIAQKRGDREAALAQFRAAAEADPRNAWFKTNLAAELLAAGRSDEAAKSYEQALDFNPKFGPAHAGLGQIAQRTGDTGAALTHFRAASEAEPANNWYKGSIAGALLALGRLDEAENAFKDALERDRGFVPAHSGLGQIAQRRGDHEAALRHFQAAAAIAPSDVLLQCSAAVELFELGRTDEAKALFEDALARRPRLTPALAGLARVAQRAGNHETAAAQFGAASQTDPANAWLRCSAGEELLHLNRLEEAEVWFRGALSLNETFAAAHNGLGRVAQRRDDHATGLAHFQRALAAEPDNRWFLSSVGSELIALRRLDEAKAIFDQLTARHPDSVHGYRGLAQIAQARGDHEQAFRDFSAAADLDPEDSWLRCAAAAQLRELGRQNEALDMAQRNAERHPSAGAPLLELSHCLRAVSLSKEASDALASAVRLEPANLGIQCALAFDHLRNWRVYEAEGVYARALAQDPKCAGALVGLGLVARQRGDYRESQDKLSAAVALGASVSAVIELTNEHIRTREWEAAERALSDALQRDPTERSLLMQRGFLRRAAGEHANALSAFAEVAKIYPKFSDAYIEKSRQAFQLGQISKAFDWLAKALLIGRRSNLAFELLANYLVMSDNIDLARSVLLYCIRVNQKSLSTFCELAKIEALSGFTGRAVILLEGARKYFGDSPELSSCKARLLQEAGLFRDACLEIEYAVRQFPHNASLNMQRVALAIAMCDPETADKLLDSEATRRDQTNPGAKFAFDWLKAHNALLKWDFDAAYEYGLSAVEKMPGEAAGPFFLGRTALLSLRLKDCQANLSHFADLQSSALQLKGTSTRAGETFIGQFLEECRLAPDILDELRDIRNVEERSDRMHQFAKLIKRASDSTIAALNFAIELRRNGYFSNNRSESFDSNIPNTIVQFWDDESLPADIVELSETWRVNNTNYTYRIFSTKTAAEFLSEAYDKSVLLAFLRAPEVTQKADLFRLAYLYLYGGFYVDIDDRCVGPLDILNRGNIDFIMYQEDIGSIGNNFIGVKARDVRIGAILMQTVSSINRGDRELLWLSTGPGLFTRVIASYIADLFLQSPGDQVSKQLSSGRIIDRGELFRVAVIHCPLKYKSTNKHWSRANSKAKAQFREKIIDIAKRIGIDETA